MIYLFGFLGTVANSIILFLKNRNGKFPTKFNIKSLLVLAFVAIIITVIMFLTEYQVRNLIVFYLALFYFLASTFQLLNILMGLRVQKE